MRRVKLAREVAEDEEFPLAARQVAMGYIEAMRFLVRAYKANQKLHWQEGDSFDGVMEELNDFLDNELGPNRDRQLFKGM